jgi:hypothetical protein
MSFESVICKVNLSIGDDSDDFKLHEENHNSIMDFLRGLEKRPRSTASVPRPTVSTATAHMEDEGRRVDVVATARGCKRRQVSYLF